MTNQLKTGRTICLTMIHAVLISSFTLHPSFLFSQGALSPPGPPGPTMKTLDQIEPRIPIKASDLPLTINSPGSYYLSGVISFNQQDTDGITITSGNVSIDLMGFSLIGPGQNVGTTGVGIKLVGSYGNISVSNGFITGWRQAGCNLGSGYNLRITDVTSTRNGAAGFYLGDNSVVSRCVAANNGYTGLIVGQEGFFLAHGCTVRNCASNGNRGAGYVLDSSSSISSCTSTLDGSDGIAVTTAVISNCAILNAGADGISAGAGSVVTSCSATGSAGAGISADAGCTVANCVSYLSVGDGFAVSSNCKLLGNLSQYGNAYGFHVTGSGNRLESNMADNNTTAGFRFDAGVNFVIKNKASYNASGFSINGNQMRGPIITGSGTISADSTANFVLP